MMSKPPVIAIALWAIVMLAAAVARAQAPLRIAYPTFAPFHSESENGTVIGFFYDIINEAVEKRMGLPVVWGAYPWQRCQANVAAGHYDAILTVPTSERAGYTVTHATPFFEKKLNVFTVAGHNKMPTILSLENIADIKASGFAVITYSGNGWHKENVASLGIKTFETAVLKSVWRMLAAKRGDIVIEWPVSAWPDIKQVGLSDKIVQTPVVLSSMPFHMLIGKKSAKTWILPEFNAIIEKMRADGTIDRIVAKYH